MKFEKLEIPDVLLCVPEIHSDQRGFFLETYKYKEYKSNGINYQFVQDNLSGSTKNVLRGLHYQINNTQGKLAQVLNGEVFDVAVDIRKNSPYFGKWVGVVLSSKNKYQLWIPPGFAHGYYVLSESAEFLYKCTDYYAPQYERTILWNDPIIGINWPLEGAPILSEKDNRGILLERADIF